MRSFHLLALAGLSAAATMLLAPRMAGATDLVYAPSNAAFGGNGMATQMLLSTAQATNKHKAPADTSPSLSRQSALQQFNDMLERAVLGQLASATTAGIFGPTGKLVPGTVETGNFRITITDLGGGTLEITTTDKASGATTSFQIGTGS